MDPITIGKSVPGFVVMGATDEHEASASWIVGVFIDRERAEDRVNKLRAMLAKHKSTKGILSAIEMDACEDAIKNAPDGDPNCLIYSNGASYYVKETWIDTIQGGQPGVR